MQILGDENLGWVVMFPSSFQPYLFLDVDLFVLLENARWMHCCVDEGKQICSFRGGGVGHKAPLCSPLRL